MLVSATPFWIMSSKNSGFIFQPFVKQYEPVIIPPFLEDFSCQFCKDASHAPFSKGIMHAFAPFIIHHLDPHNEDPKASFHTPELDAPDPCKLLLSRLRTRKQNSLQEPNGYVGLGVVGTHNIIALEGQFE